MHGNFTLFKAQQNEQMKVVGRRRVTCVFNGKMSDEYLEQLLDEVPQLHEVCNYVRTAHWYELGIQLQLSTVDLGNIKSDSAVTDKLSLVYDVWLNKRADAATRRSLLMALQTDHVGQKRIAVEYKKKLMTMVSLLNTGLFWCK